MSAGLKFVLRFDLRTERLYGPQLAPARTHDQAIAAQLPALPLQSLLVIWASSMSTSLRLGGHGDYLS